MIDYLLVIISGFVCAAQLFFRWFRPWRVTGPTPYGNTVCWTQLRCRAAVGNPTPRTKSSESPPFRHKYIEHSTYHTHKHTHVPTYQCWRARLSLLLWNVINPSHNSYSSGEKFSEVQPFIITHPTKTSIELQKTEYLACRLQPPLKLMLCCTYPHVCKST